MKNAMTQYNNAAENGVIWTQTERTLMDRWSTAGHDRTLWVLEAPGRAVAACYASVEGVVVGGWIKDAGGCREVDGLGQGLRSGATMADLLAEHEPLFPSALVWDAEERAVLDDWVDAQDDAGRYLQCAPTAAGAAVWCDGAQVGRIVKRSDGVAALDADDGILVQSATLAELLAGRPRFDVATQKAL